jgi:sugar lactone lactonase YvrE
MRRLNRNCFSGGVLACMVALFCAPAQAQTVTFGGPVGAGNGSNEIGGMVTSTALLNIQSAAGVATNKLGTFYLTDSQGNAVYSFIPATSALPATYQKLNFSGLNGPGAIAVDSSGDLFVSDVNNDRIVELTAGGSQKSIAVPQSGYPLGVAVDGSGNLYFSAGFADNSPGAVFKLASGASTPTQIGTGLSNPKGLAVDPAGNLFIADYSNQRIVEISASGTQTTALSLTNFPSHVAVDNNDNILTDGSPNGYVIEVQSGDTDQIAVLPSPIIAFAGLALDGNGNLYAVSGLAGDGAGPTFYESSTKVIQLPQANVCQAGGNAPTGGSSGCTSSVTLPFWIWSSVDLGTPQVLTEGTAGLDFTQETTQPASCTAGQITLAAGEASACEVTVDFTPQAAGPRRGAVEIVDSSGDVLAQLLLDGVGIGPQLSITANGAAVVSNTLAFSAPNTGLSAVSADAAGNLYVTDSFGSTSQIYKISPSGSQNTIPISNIYAPGRVEIDGAGDLYLPAGYGDYMFSPTGSSSSTPPAPLIGNLHGNTAGLALDGLGDIDMVTDNIGLVTGAVYRAQLDGSVILAASATSNDGFGDAVEDPWLATADTGGRFMAPIVGDGGNLVEVSPLEQSFEPFLDLQTLNGNFTELPQESGVLAVTPGGDLYFNIAGSVYDTSGRNLTSGVPGSAGAFTLDSQANLYAIASNGSSTSPVLVEVPAIQQPFAFADTQAGTSSSAQVFTAFNSGNGSMTFSSIAASEPFALDASKTTCSASQVLAPLSSCTIGVKFSPTATGTVSGSLTVAVAGLTTPQFVLTGTGTGAPVSTTTALATSATALTAGNPLTLTATVTAASGSSAEGTVTFQNGSTNLGNANLNSAGVAALTISPAAGTYAVTATYGGSTTDLASTSSTVEITVAPPAATTIALGITPNPAAYQQTVNFAVDVTSSGVAPTGTVTIMDGTTTVALETLNAGSASYTNATLAAGQHSITASYSGDANNQPSASTAVILTIAPIMVQVASPSATTIAAGGSITANINITSVNNYAGSVALACAVAYQGAGSPTDAPSCSVSPASVTLSAGGSANASLTITTTEQSARLDERSSSPIALCGFGAGGLLLLLCWRKRSRGAWFAGFLLLVLGTLAGCNNHNNTPTTPSNPGTASGSYAVTLTSTANQIATTQSFDFSVQ